MTILTAEDAEHGPWLAVLGTRTLPGETTPFSVNRVYVPARYAAVADALSQETAVFRAIERTFGVTVGRVTQAMSAIACPAEDAARMDLPPSAPALRVEARLYAGDGGLLEVSDALFDPARFQLRTDVHVETTLPLPRGSSEPRERDS
ncbi:UTRA domain-containing protein [Jannaschia sp.]|nr:UTRA domain-containing protein [Jannaschia sp.]